MESPESGNGAGNCSVGSIVWVRRRNGSWWPGKILGPDELSASHVMSPRSGTPVKLLGREDASVDWYNLEKSKRVKAFRCGEFDDCIERAEATQGMPPKKREKYARREDAILHALELEKQMIENRSEEVDYSSDCKGGKSPQLAEKELLMASECLEIRNEGQLLPRTADAGKGLSFPNEDINKEKDVCLQEVKEEIQLHVTDNDSMAKPRMRGLLEFSLRSAPSDLKNCLLDPSNGSPKNIRENGSCSNHDDGLSSSGVVSDYCENPSEKRKRLQEGPGEDFMAKRHDRHHSCDQVLEKSAKFPTSPLQPDNNGNSIFKSEEEQPGMAHPAKRNRYAYLTSEGKADLVNTKALPTMTEGTPAKFEECNFMQVSGAYEDNTIESTEDTETDSSETDSLDSDSDDMASLSEGAASIELQPKYPGKSVHHQGYGSLSSEELEDTAFADEACHPLANDTASTGVGVSRWQLKGKRNNRSLLKRPSYQTGKKFRSILAGYRSKSPDGINTPRGMKWEHGDWRDQTASRGYWDDSVEYFDPLIVRRQHHEGKIMLIDVDLKVQSSYQREHVPMISLMSKIDGRAMVGHPVQVEVLEDGSTDSLLVGSGEWFHETLEHDTTLPPMWRTARRTANFRVPRPDLSLTCDERAKLQSVDGRKGAAGPSNSGIMTERINHISDRKPSRKPVKKISISFNQKTRTLSSIASQQRQSCDPKSSGNNYQVEGLVKPESLPTAVACIPVKLVFSRLQEELIGRHP